MKHEKQNRKRRRRIKTMPQTAQTFTVHVKLTPASSINSMFRILEMIEKFKLSTREHTFFSCRFGDGSIISMSGSSAAQSASLHRHIFNAMSHSNPSLTMLAVTYPMNNSEFDDELLPSIPEHVLCSMADRQAEQTLLRSSVLLLNRKYDDSVNYSGHNKCWAVITDSTYITAFSKSDSGVIKSIYGVEGNRSAAHNRERNINYIINSEGEEFDDAVRRHMTNMNGAPVYYSSDNLKIDCIPNTKR